MNYCNMLDLKSLRVNSQHVSANEKAFILVNDPLTEPVTDRG